METILDRVQQVKKLHHISNEAIAKHSGISVYTIRKQMQGLYNLKLDTIVALVEMCPTVDSNWILTGKRMEVNSNVVELISALESAVENLKGKN